MLMRYIALSWSTKKSSGWYQTDTEDFKNLMKYNKSYDLVYVELQNGQKWHWSRRKGWRKIN